MEKQGSPHAVSGSLFFVTAGRALYSDGGNWPYYLGKKQFFYSLLCHFYPSLNEAIFSNEIEPGLLGAFAFSYPRNGSIVRIQMGKF